MCIEPNINFAQEIYNDTYLDVNCIIRVLAIQLVDLAFFVVKVSKPFEQRTSKIISKHG